MSNWASKTTDLLVENDVIKSEEQAIYTYGLNQAAIILLNIVTTLIIGFVLGMVFESIIFTIAYIPIRSYAGGYHARTAKVCYIWSVVITVLALQMIKYTSWARIELIIIGCILSGIIVLMAPVEDENKPLDELEVKEYSKRTRKLLVLELLLILVFSMISIGSISTCIVVAQLVLVMMLILGKIRNIYIKR